MKTHYQILKVSEDAPDEVIRAAWRALSMRHHPDLNPSDAGAAELMQQLNEAYAVLGDKARRHAYDIRLAVVRASERPERLTTAGAAKDAACATTTTATSEASGKRDADHGTRCGADVLSCPSFDVYLTDNGCGGAALYTNLSWQSFG